VRGPGLFSEMAGTSPSPTLSRSDGAVDVGFHRKRHLDGPREVRVRPERTSSDDDRILQAGPHGAAPGTLSRSSGQTLSFVSKPDDDSVVWGPSYDGLVNHGVCLQHRQAVALREEEHSTHVLARFRQEIPLNR
jgi:hypothetical protein